MKKLIQVLMVLILFTSCTKTDPIPDNNDSKMLISNINTKNSQKNIRDIMNKTDLSKDNIDRFFDQVDFFNKNVGKGMLIDQDFKETDSPLEYDIYAMQDKFFEKYPSFPGVNCRITTFGLISDKVDINNPSYENNDILTIDYEALSNPPIKTLSGMEIPNFNDFYKVIDLKDQANYDQKIQTIADNLSKMGVGNLGKSYSLISVYVYNDLEPDVSEVFVGHTGLLFNLLDGRIMLVEKLAFTAPYQAVIFKNRDDLYDYLMTLYDTSNDQYPNKPIIFENNQELKKLAS